MNEDNPDIIPAYKNIEYVREKLQQITNAIHNLTTSPNLKDRIPEKTQRKLRDMWTDRDILACEIDLLSSDIGFADYQGLQNIMAELVHFERSARDILKDIKSLIY